MNPPFEYDFDFEEEDSDNVEEATSKLIMDFGLQQHQPEKITIQVLQRLIKENPDKMYLAARMWLHPKEPRG